MNEPMCECKEVYDCGRTADEHEIERLRSALKAEQERSVKLEHLLRAASAERDRALDEVEAMRNTLRWIAGRFCHGRACIVANVNGPAERCEHQVARETLELLVARQPTEGK